MSGAIKGGRPKGEPIYFRRGGAKVTAHRVTRTAVEELIADTPDASPLIADLLRGTADIADTARRRQEIKVWLDASARLERLAEKLTRGGKGAKGTAGQSGTGDSSEDRLGHLISGSPTVGDGEDS